MGKITIHWELLVAATPEVVWDYTQDWRRRRDWDGSVAAVEIIQESPPQRVRARFGGGLWFDVAYKKGDRPRITTLTMTNSTSAWVTGGGGSWRYEDVGGATRWSQSNTLVLRDHFLMRAVSPMLKMMLGFTTRRAMRKAKRILEAR
ncbi:MAG: SRPBCC family protein [Deltaproteobacteria bacterium]|nr:SRPBCC family protein [Deltaproteobacteria bacterium]